MIKLPQKYSIRTRPNGYRQIYWFDPTAKKQRYIFEHVYVWSSRFGPIPPGYIVHHIDEDRANNDIDNLRVMTRAAHNILHFTVYGGPDRNELLRERNKEMAMASYYRHREKNAAKNVAHVAAYRERMKDDPEFIRKRREYGRKRRALLRMRKLVSSQSLYLPSMGES